MGMMNYKRTGVSLLLLVILLSACKQYESGPAFSLYTKRQRISGTWYFNKATFGDIDSTTYYQMGSLEFLLYDGKGKDRGAFTWNKIYGSQDFNPDNVFYGSWELIADKDSIRMIVLNKQVRDTMNWEIVRLSYDQWWMQRNMNETEKERWELWKWVF